MDPQSSDPTVGPMLGPQDPAAPNPLRPGVASVLVYSRGVVRVRWPNGELEGGGRLLRRPVIIHDVDLGIHHSTFSADLPASGGGVLHFSAEIDIEWRVKTPLLVVNTNTDNVVVALQPRLLEEIRQISSRYPVDTPIEAEHAIRAWCQSAEASRIGEDCGLTTRVFVRLNANAQAVAIQQKVQEKFGDVQVDAVASDDMLRKVRMYQTLIEGGQLSQAAMQIAQDPTNISGVIGALWDQGAASREETVNLLKILISSGAVQPHQINGQAKAVLAWMETSTAALMGPGQQFVEPAAPPRLVGDRFERRQLDRGRDERAGEAARPTMRDRWRQQPEPPAPPARAVYEDEVPQRRRRPVEPTYVEPGRAEPRYDESRYDEPAYDEPRDARPAYQGPKRQTSDYQDSDYQGQSYRDSEHRDSNHRDSRYEEPAADEAAYDEPAYEEQPLPERRPARERATVREEPERPRQRASREAWRDDEADDEDRDARPRATSWRTDESDDEDRDTRRRTAGRSAADSSAQSWQSSGYFDDVD